MKHGNEILKRAPILLGLLVLLSGIFFYWKISLFEDTLQRKNQAELELKTELTAQIILSLLNEEKTAEAVAFCNTFDNNILRLTLVSSDGKVIADSAGKMESFANHGDRTEIKRAFEGVPTTITRYSESLNMWMTYHALLLKTAHGDYVLRAAIPANQTAWMSKYVKINVFSAFLFGAVIILLIAVYYQIHFVQKPLSVLEQATISLASGKLNWQAEMPHHAQGSIQKLAHSMENMTERLKEQMDKLLRERNERIAILNALDESILLFDLNGNAIRFNRAAAIRFELSNTSTKFNIWRCGIPGLPETVMKSLNSKKEFTREFSFERKGSDYTFFIKGHILEEADESYLLMSITDLTGLRKLESFRSDFIANVSHEIKTPLTCILGAAETLEQEQNLTAEQRKNLFNMLSMQSRRLNALIEDILSLAAIERRQMEPSANFAPVRLDELVLRAIKMDNGSIPVSFYPKEPLLVNGDLQLLEQAVLNILSNAQKYSKSDRIEVALSENEGKAVLTIRDFGIGIPPEHQERIFERFYRVHKERSRANGGTGLGLAIVKHVIQLHRGTVSLESVSGQGCTFTITLPVYTP